MFRTKHFYYLDTGTLLSLNNTHRSKLATVWLTVINILSHFIYIIIARLIKSLKKIFRIKLPDSGIQRIIVALM